MLRSDWRTAHRYCPNLQLLPLEHPDPHPACHQTIGQHHVPEATGWATTAGHREPAAGTRSRDQRTCDLSFFHEIPPHGGLASDRECHASPMVGADKVPNIPVPAANLLPFPAPACRDTARGPWYNCRKHARIVIRQADRHHGTARNERNHDPRGDQAIQRRGRGGRPGPDRAARVALRLHRPQRVGQDDDAADDHAHPAARPGRDRGPGRARTRGPRTTASATCPRSAGCTSG